MSRRIDIDILKGLLIISVVIGHSTLKLPWVDVFWFHMPAFFIISGYFMKSLDISMHEVKKKFLRLIVPYLSWCVVMYLAFRPEPVLKNVVRVLYAGDLNTLQYSYPYWFANALFTAFVGFHLLGKFPFGMIRGGKWLIYSVILYILIHIWSISIKDFINKPIPWSMNHAIAAMFYMLVGYCYKRHEDMLKKHKAGLWALTIAVVFTIANHWLETDYIINMKSMKFHHPFLDIVVPCSFSLALLYLSRWLEYAAALSQCFAHIGQCSMTIFFTHAAMLHYLTPYPQWLSVIIAVAVGCIVHNLLNINSHTRLLFIGEEKRKK